MTTTTTPALPTDASIEAMRATYARARHVAEKVAGKSREWFYQAVIERTHDDDGTEADRHGGRERFLTTLAIDAAGWALVDADETTRRRWFGWIAEPTLAIHPKGNA